MLKILAFLILLLVVGCSEDNTQVNKIVDSSIDSQQHQLEQQKTARLLISDEYRFSKVKRDYSQSRLTDVPECPMVLQFVAANAEGIDFIQAHIDNFKSDKRLAALPICINQPVWFEIDDMSCSNNADERLKCDIAPLIKLADLRDFTHAIVVGESGKANVHNGIMYLDYKDSYSVFVHELAHFAGFVDEYPLSGELADNICKTQSHPNISVFVPNIRHSNNLIAVRTCDNHTNQAFKLVKEMTFMEYHDVGLIPQQYLDIWKQRLISVEQLTPAYVNFAQYYEELGDAANADRWWHDYQQYL